MSLLDTIGDKLSSVGEWFTSGITGVFYRICYMIGAGLSWIIGVMNQCFSVISGIGKVRYEGKTQSLIDVFFGNSVVENIYWAMAAIGILLCFVFAIIAVAKKAADSGDKMRQSLGDILTGMFKGIIIIVSMTFIFNAVLSLSNKLFTQINYIFNNAENLGQEDTIEYTDEQYAAMARVLDTIANYSLTPSYNSRYNLNSCYNDIRADLQYLEQQGVFDFYYITEDSGESWQSALQSIVNAADLSKDLSFDIYHKSVSDAILKCMNLLKTDSSFGPLKSYTRQYTGYGSNVPLDRMIFLMCTMHAAKNPVYNQNPAIDDSLRGAYYMGEKSIYDYSQISSDFDVSSIDFIMLYLVAFKLIWDLAVIIFDCVARIFNMIFLYLIAPPFIGVMPLDEGGKFKQWMTAFIVQCFGVFGTLVAMRVLLIFIPIVLSSDLVLFDSSILNLVAKVVLILGGMATAKRASGVITGILADNAGFQAISASAMGDTVRGTLGHIRNRITGYGDTGNMRRNDGGLRSLLGPSGRQSGGQSGGSSDGGKNGGKGNGKISGGTKDKGPTAAKKDAVKAAAPAGRGRANNPPAENNGQNAPVEDPVRADAPADNNGQNAPVENPVRAEAPVENNGQNAPVENPVRADAPADNNGQNAPVENPVRAEAPADNNGQNAPAENPVRAEAPADNNGQNVPVENNNNINNNNDNNNNNIPPAQNRQIPPQRPERRIVRVAPGMDPLSRMSQNNQNNQGQ